jgi:hypothetical protein
MMSGSCSNSFKEEIQGLVFCSETEKKLLKIVAAPVSQGSIRMVKEPGNSPGEDKGAIEGEKVSRKDVSPLSDCTVNDIAAVSVKQESVNRHEDKISSTEECQTGHCIKRLPTLPSKERHRPGAGIPEQEARRGLGVVILDDIAAHRRTTFSILSLSTPRRLDPLLYSGHRSSLLFFILSMSSARNHGKHQSGLPHD